MHSMRFEEITALLKAEYAFHSDQANLKFTDAYVGMAAEIQKLTSLEGGKPDYPLMIT
jgi:hypothetical protein